MRYIDFVRKGDRVAVALDSLDDEGAGRGEAHGVCIHVRGGLPGERVEALVEHVSPHHPDAWATVEKLEAAAAERIAPVCKAYGACGGCVLEHYAYPAQVTWKRQRLLAELGRRSALADVAVAPCVASPRPLEYRNKSKLVYARGKDGQVRLGAYAPRSHDVVELAGCRVSEPPLDAVAGALAGVLGAQDVRPYDEKLAEGVLRHAILRVNHQGRVLAVLVTATAEWPDGVSVARALRKLRPEVVGVVQNINRSRGNVLLGMSEQVLDGVGTLDDLVGTVHVRLSAGAFFQVNRAVASLLYSDLCRAAALTGTERVVDCYSGIGGIALTLAPRAGEVVGIEEHAQAVRDAVAAAALNHASRTRFVAGDVEAELAGLGTADVVVLNPPRRGCVPQVLEAAARLSPRLLAYVSCAPDTLARDLELLHGHGLITRSVHPYDMLPQTPHVEALAILTPG